MDGPGRSPPPCSCSVGWIERTSSGRRSRLTIRSTWTLALSTLACGSARSAPRHERRHRQLRGPRHARVRVDARRHHDGVDRAARRGRSGEPAGRRDRHHEHHARVGDRADPRDRRPDGDRARVRRDDPVPDRGGRAVGVRRRARRRVRCARNGARRLADGGAVRGGRCLGGDRGGVLWRAWGCCSVGSRPNGQRASSRSTRSGIRDDPTAGAMRGLRGRRARALRPTGKARTSATPGRTQRDAPWRAGGTDDLVPVEYRESGAACGAARLSYLNLPLFGHVQARGDSSITAQLNFELDLEADTSVPVLMDTWRSRTTAAGRRCSPRSTCGNTPTMATGRVVFRSDPGRDPRLRHRGLQPQYHTDTAWDGNRQVAATNLRVSVVLPPGVLPFHHRRPDRAHGVRGRRLPRRLGGHHRVRHLVRVPRDHRAPGRRRPLHPRRRPAPVRRQVDVRRRQARRGRRPRHHLLGTRRRSHHPFPTCDAIIEDVEIDRTTVAVVGGNTYIGRLIAAGTATCDDGTKRLAVADI